MIDHIIVGLSFSNNPEVAVQKYPDKCMHDKPNSRLTMSLQCYNYASNEDDVVMVTAIMMVGSAHVRHIELQWPNEPLTTENGLSSWFIIVDIKDYFPQ